MKQVGLPDPNEYLRKSAEIGDIEGVRLALNNGANVNSQRSFLKSITMFKTSDNTSTALHLAARYGHLEIVKLLIKEGAFLDIKTLDGYTPLDMAEHYKQTEVKNYLRNLMIDANEYIKNQAINP